MEEEETPAEKIRRSALAKGLSADMDMDEFIARFVRNVRALGFTYTMGAKNWEQVLNGGEGDCNTLSHAAIETCAAFFGKGTAVLKGKGMPYFVAGGGVVIDGQTGNVDGEHWRFEGHYWIIADGTTYDLLFRGNEVDNTNWVEEDTEFRPSKDERYKNYANVEKYGDYIIYLRNTDGPLSSRYTTDPELAMTKDFNEKFSLEVRQEVAEQKFKKQVKTKCCTLF